MVGQLFAGRKKGTSVKKAEVMAKPPIFEALRTKQTNVIIDLINEGMDVNIRDPKLGRTPLMIAVTTNNLRLLKKLIEEKANLELKDKQGMSALLYAARDGNMETAKLLIKAGADVNTANNKGKTALMMAIHRLHPEIALYLLASGANPVLADKAGNTPLMEAADHEEPAVAQVLLEKGVPVDQLDNLGGTALLRSTGHRVLTLLLNAGADINLRSNENSTPLLAATYAKKIDLESIRILLAAGVNPNEADTFGITPLINTAKVGNIPAMQLLLDGGALINYTAAPIHQTALLVASSFGQLPAVKFLIEKGADLNAPDTNGVTPLIAATQNGLFDVAEELSRAGADKEIRDAVGLSALDYANNGGNAALIELLSAEPVQGE